MGYLLDTWAWIELYDGTELGEAIFDLIKSDESLHTSIVTLAEISDSYQRGNLRTDHSWNEISGFVRSKSEVHHITPEIAAEAGEIKHEQREEKPDFGLMDAIILATARENDLEVVSGDPHLENLERSAELEKL